MTRGRQDAVHGLAEIVLPLDRLSQNADRQVGCSAAQISVLARLMEQGPMSLSGLVAHEQVSLATQARTVDALVRSGLVVRAENAADRRAVRLEVTDRGRQIVEKARHLRARLLDEALDVLSAGEWQALELAVSAVQRALRTPKV